MVLGKEEVSGKVRKLNESENENMILEVTKYFQYCFDSFQKSQHCVPSIAFN